VGVDKRKEEKGGCSDDGGEREGGRAAARVDAPAEDADGEREREREREGGRKREKKTRAAV
jgi:hypothetical protein